MPRSTLYAVLVGLLTALPACESGADRSATRPASLEMADDEMADDMEMGEVELTAEAEESLLRTASQAAPSQAADTAAVERKLIRRANVRLRVDDYAEARAAVAALAERFGAYVGGENERRYGGRVENTLTLRVEAERFEELMGALLGVGEVEARAVDTEDVTRQYVDLAARLRARRAVEARYAELLARANSVEDVLAVERQLAQVREEIESATGQLRYLRNQVALSTITLTLVEESVGGLAAGPGFRTRIGRAFEAGWAGVQALVVGFVGLWPLWLLVLLTLPFVRRYERRRKVRRAADPAA